LKHLDRRIRSAWEGSRRAGCSRGTGRQAGDLSGFPRPERPLNRPDFQPGVASRYREST
jgi:hypothetical protein